ncbi:type II toxin-antitoxin system YoeB family toxin [Ilyomonas limi]|uniref:Type II toxin-antitoxin system YoeB family toxin n=1 Tax=Ilyomonas limi TaxID=2575867 RepID=A0A4U3L6D9_9BACT|nr:type II toxin-antitoxin system YoeB family toxin [Ilyomonas limi]TKK70798.1 type II toxin-antitoxin system YoeB family toxin [Ilyomonas limi]
MLLFEGIVKSEPLIANWMGYQGKRITDEHRLVYEVDNGIIIIVALKELLGKRKYGNNKMFGRNSNTAFIRGLST